MRRMWGVENPLDSRVEQVLFCFIIFNIDFVYTCTFVCRSSVAPTNLVPRSERKICTFPLILINQRKALINADELSESITSMCMARMTRHVKSTPHRFEEALPPRVFRETTCHGPKTSTQSLVNGGFGSSLSFGISAIFRIASLRRNFLHETPFLNTEDMRRFPLVIQNPAARMAPSVS